MKKTLFAVITIFSTISIYATDISGMWFGKSYQFDTVLKKYVNEFNYIYSLEQDKGGVVNGVVTVTNLDGYHVEMKLRGYIIHGDFYFSEYKDVDSIKADDSISCFMNGRLKISTTENGATLYGKSFSSQLTYRKAPVSIEDAHDLFNKKYGVTCSSGYTFLSKDYEYLDDRVVKKDNVEISEELNLEISSESSTDFLNIKFSLPKISKVVLDVVNVKGELIQNVTDETLKEGNHTFKFSSNENLQESICYVRMRVGDRMFSKAIKM